MRTPICDDLGIEFPIFAFTHCRDVVVAVALDLLRAYSPPRPVRLLGVRVASFTGEDSAPDEPQAQLQLDAAA